MLFNDRRYLVGFGVAGVALIVAACAVPNATKRMKKDLANHGTIDAEWEIRDDEAEKTYTYVMLRAESAVYETYVITASDGQRNVTRDQVGGIDGTGCYLLENGITTKWVAQLPQEALQETTKSGSKTRTKCLEYKDGPGWAFIPEKDRKAAQPPPPPPPPKPTMLDQDMGGADGGPAAPAAEEDKGAVESAIP